MPVLTLVCHTWHITSWTFQRGCNSYSIKLAKAAELQISTFSLVTTECNMCYYSVTKSAELTTSYSQCLFNIQNSYNLQEAHRAHLSLLSETSLNNHHKNLLSKNKDSIFKVECVYSLLAKTTLHLQTGILRKYVSCTKIPSATQTLSKQVQALLQIQNTHFVKISYFFPTHFILMATEVG